MNLIPSLSDELVPVLKDLSAIKKNGAPLPDVRLPQSSIDGSSGVCVSAYRAERLKRAYGLPREKINGG